MITTSDKTVGQYLRGKRTEKGLSQKDLANALGIDFTLISKIELGERTLSLDLIPGIAKALKTEFKELQIDLVALKVVEEFGKEEHASEALKMALKKIN